MNERRSSRKRARAQPRLSKRLDNRGGRASRTLSREQRWMMRNQTRRSSQSRRSSVAAAGPRATGRIHAPLTHAPLLPRRHGLRARASVRRHDSRDMVLEREARRVLCFRPSAGGVFAVFKVALACAKARTRFEASREITLLVAPCDQHIKRHGRGQQQMTDGHARRRPDGQQQADIHRMRNPTVEEPGSEALWRRRRAAVPGAHLLDAEQIQNARRARRAAGSAILRRKQPDRVAQRGEATTSTAIGCHSRMSGNRATLDA